MHAPKRLAPSSGAGPQPASIRSVIHSATAAIVMSVAAALGPLALLQTDDLAILGRPSILGWGVFAVSLAAPLCSLMALKSAISPPHDANLVSRGFANCCALSASVACLYLAAHGWIGLRIWDA